MPDQLSQRVHGILGLRLGEHAGIWVSRSPISATVGVAEVQPHLAVAVAPEARRIEEAHGAPQWSRDIVAHRP